MAAPNIVPISNDMLVSGNYTVEFTALNPSDGSTVTAVVISGASITGKDMSEGNVSTGTTGPDTTPFPLLVPVANAA